MAPTMNGLLSPFASPLHDGSYLHAIECVAHGARVALAADAIERIVEYEVSPLPLAGPWVAGFAAHDAFVIVSVRLQSGTRTNARRQVKAALLTTNTTEFQGSSRRTRWAVEVDEVLTLVRVKPSQLDPRSEPEGDAPPWLGPAITTDGRAVQWLDVAYMLRTFGAGAGA